MFTYGCTGCSLLFGFPLVGASVSSCCAQASPCSGFSRGGAQALGCTGFGSYGSQALEHRLGSCDTWRWLPRSLWDLPRPGIKPVSPVSSGGFLATEPPGESPLSFLEMESRAPGKLTRTHVSTKLIYTYYGWNYACCLEKRRFLRGKDYDGRMEVRKLWSKHRSPSHSKLEVYGLHCREKYNR